MTETKDMPLNMPCDDPEGCKHFKAEMQQAERIKELRAENQQLRIDRAELRGFLVSIKWKAKQALNPVSKKG